MKDTATAPVFSRFELPKRSPSWSHPRPAFTVCERQSYDKIKTVAR